MAQPGSASSFPAMRWDYRAGRTRNLSLTVISLSFPAGDSGLSEATIWETGPPSTAQAIHTGPITPALQVG